MLQSPQPLPNSYEDGYVRIDVVCSLNSVINLLLHTIYILTDAGRNDVSVKSWMFSGSICTG